jgi:hypothetical protein
VTPSDGTEVSLLGSEKELTWRAVDNTIEIDLTNIGIHDLPCDYVFTFKFTDIKPHPTK